MPKKETENCKNLIKEQKKILEQQKAIFPFVKDLAITMNDCKKLLEKISGSYGRDKLLTVPQTADILQIDKRTVYRFIKSKKLRVVKLSSGSFRIRREDLESFIRKKTFPRKEKKSS